MDDSLIYVKLHNTRGGRILAMCDASALNKVLKEGEVIIDTKTYADFYKGRLMNVESLDSVTISDINSANIVGEESVNAAVERYIIAKKNVKKVKGVPYAQAYRIPSR